MVELISHQAFFHNIKVIRHLDPDLPQIIGDPGQLQQVFSNLLLNAADAMTGAGEIIITSRAGALGDGVMSISRIRAAASRRTSSTKYSNPFLPPNRRVKARGWGCPSSTGSSSATAAASTPRARPAGGPPLPSDCPWNPRNRRGQVEFWNQRDALAKRCVMTDRYTILVVDDEEVPGLGCSRVLKPRRLPGAHRGQRQAGPGSVGLRSR